MALRILELVVIVGIWRCEIVKMIWVGDFVEIVIGMAGLPCIRTNLSWTQLLPGQVFELESLCE